MSLNQQKKISPAIPSLDKADQPEIHYLPTPAEFDFNQCLVYLGRSPKEILHFIEGDTLRKLISVNGRLVLMALTSSSAGGIRIQILNEVASKSTIQRVKAYVRHWFDLDADLRPFYRLAEQDALLRELVRRYFGLRIIKIDDLFQALCWAITGQQINLAFAYTLFQRFIRLYGAAYAFDGQPYWLFPTPARIAGLTVVELQQLQFSAAKAIYLIELAKHFASREISRESLAALGDYEQAKAALLALRGVGPWTANYVMMRCAGYRCAFPIQDIGLHNAIKQQLRLTRKPSIQEIQKLAAGWHNWQAYATFYLYRSLL